MIEDRLLMSRDVLIPCLNTNEDHDRRPYGMICRRPLFDVSRCLLMSLAGRLRNLSCFRGRNCFGYRIHFAGCGIRYYDRCFRRLLMSCAFRAKTALLASYVMCLTMRDVSRCRCLVMSHEVSLTSCPIGN